MNDSFAQSSLPTERVSVQVLRIHVHRTAPAWARRCGGQAHMYHPSGDNVRYCSHCCWDGQRPSSTVRTATPWSSSVPYSAWPWWCDFTAPLHIPLSESPLPLILYTTFILDDPHTNPPDNKVIRLSYRRNLHICASDRGLSAPCARKTSLVLSYVVLNGGWWPGSESSGVQGVHLNRLGVFLCTYVDSLWESVAVTYRLSMNVEPLNDETSRS